MSTFRRMLMFVERHRGKALLAMLLGFGTVGSNIALMGTSGYLIASAALRPETVLLLWIPIVGVRTFGISRAVFRYLERLVSHDVTFRILARMRTWLYCRIEPRGSVLLETKRSGEVLGTVISDVEELKNFYLRVLTPMAVALLAALFGVGLLTSFHLVLGLILAGMLALAGVLVPLGSHLVSRRTGQSAVEQRGELYAGTSDLINGLPELLVYGRAEEAVRKLELVQDQLTASQTRHSWVGAVTSGLMLGTSHLALWLVLTAGISLVTAGVLGGVYLPAVSLIALASFEAVNTLPEAFRLYGQTMAAARRLFELADGERAEGGSLHGGASASTDIDEPSEREPVHGVSRVLDAGEPSAQEPLHSESRVSGVAEQAQPETRAASKLGAVSEPLSGPFSIQLDQVTFRYGPDEPDALRGITMSVEPGQWVAIVGESGAGKSSLTQVLLKIRPYQSGRIRLGGLDLQELDEELVRDRFGVVPQQIQLFHASVADNLRLGKQEATLEELQQVSELALLHDRIAGLPQGYDTLVGEFGAKLSGGERQRLAIARALLKDAPAYLFDEPTAGLDAVTEQELLRRLRAALAGKTVLWISHTLTGLEQMDRIIVLSRGQVVEQGTHSELMQRRGEYWRLRQAIKQ